MPLTPSEYDLLRHGARRFAIELSPRETEALGLYLDLLERWRRHARLISRRQTRAEIIRKHIVDSLAVISQLRGCRRIADVGSGAGLPGIPIAVVRADARVTLVEANRRKANFLREVIHQLTLANAEVVEDRVETVTAQYDAVTCRAVGSLIDLLDKVRTLSAPAGLVIAMKGPAGQQDLAALDLAALGFTLEATEPYTLDAGEQRILLCLRRRCST